VNLNEPDEQLNEAVSQVQNGVKIWEKTKIELGIQDNSCVLLFSKQDRDVNEVFLKYLQQFVERKNYTSAYILSVDEWVVNNVTTYSKSVGAVKQLSEYDTSCLLKYYSLMEFSNRFYVCSITEPEGRLGELLIDKEIPLDEIVCAGVYRMYDYTRC